MNKIANNLFLILIVLSCISCTANKKLYTNNSISKDDFSAEIEDESSKEISEAYPLKDIVDNQAFVKYYLFSKHDLYTSRGLSQITQSNYKLSQLHPKNSEIQERAFLLTLANRDFEKANGLLKIKKTPKVFDAQEELQLTMLLKNEEHKKAEEILDTLLRKKNRLPHLKVLKAYFEYQKHKDIAKLEKEIISIKSSLALDGFKYYYIAREFEAIGQTKKALEFYTIAMFKYGLKTPEIFSRWFYCLNKEDSAKAEKIIAKSKKFGKGVFLIESTLIETAKIKKLDNSIKEMTSQIFFDLGWSISETSTNVIGLDFLALSELLTEKSNNKVKYQYAKALLANKWKNEAALILQTIKPESEYYVASRLLLADILGSNKNLKQATLTLENLKRKHLLKTAYVDSLLGQLYLNAQQFKKVVETLDNAMKTFDSTKLYFSRAVAHERLGNYSNAIKDLNIAAKKNPKNPLVLNYLGYLLIDLNKDVDKGLQLIQRSIELDPTNAASIDSLGWAYIKLKQYQKGLMELEKAYQLNSSDPVITGHLGDAYLHNDRKKEALLYWKKALALESEDQREIQRIRDQLKKYTAK